MLERQDRVWLHASEFYCEGNDEFKERERPSWPLRRTERSIGKLIERGGAPIEEQVVDLESAPREAFTDETGNFLRASVLRLRLNKKDALFLCWHGVAIRRAGLDFEEIQAVTCRRVSGRASQA